MNHHQILNYHSLDLRYLIVNLKHFEYVVFMMYLTNQVIFHFYHLNFAYLY